MIITHRHADVDAYCSAYGVARLLKNLIPSIKVSVSSPSGLSSLAKRLYEEFPVRIVGEPSFQEKDLVVIVDTGHASLIEDWVDKLQKAACSKVLIDHHPPSASLRKIAQYSVMDEKASSTSEIVFNVWKQRKIRANKRVCQALLTGIMADSQHLTLANEETLFTVGELCRLGASLRKSRQLLRISRERPEVIARLKAAKRIQIFEAKKWVFAVTTVGSFHASVARSLLDLGADLSLAVGAHNSGSRGSFRSTQEFYEKTEIHLGTDIAKRIASRLPGGSGGGHPTAASVQCLAPPSTLFDEAVRIIGEGLREQLKPIV